MLINARGRALRLPTGALQTLRVKKTMDPSGCKPSPTPSPGRRGERLLEDRVADPDLHVEQSAAEGGELFLLR